MNYKISKDGRRMKEMSTRALLYCRLRAEGKNKGVAYEEAGYKSNNRNSSWSAAVRMERRPEVEGYIKKLQESNFVRDALSYSEKRSFLAKAVRTPLSEVNEDSPLCVERVVTTLESGQVVEKVKKVDPLRAVEIDNKMVGDNFADRSPAAANPFLFLVTMGSGMGGVGGVEMKMVEGKEVECV